MKVLQNILPNMDFLILSTTILIKLLNSFLVTPSTSAKSGLSCRIPINLKYVKNKKCLILIL